METMNAVIDVLELGSLQIIGVLVLCFTLGIIAGQFIRLYK